MDDAKECKRHADSECAGAVSSDTGLCAHHQEAITDEQRDGRGPDRGSLAAQGMAPETPTDTR